MSKITILVAAGELIGGPVGGERFILAAGEELSAGARKKLGLSADDVSDLVARGQIVELEARQAEPVADDGIAALRDRAEKAEAALKAEQAEVAELKKQLAGAAAKG